MTLKRLTDFTRQAGEDLGQHPAQAANGDRSGGTWTRDGTVTPWPSSLEDCLEALPSESLAVVGERLDWGDESLIVTELSRELGPGNFITLHVESDNVNEVFVGIGQRGV